MPISAMILAAGRGERLRPLTDATPKALVEVAGEPLIVRHLRALRKAGTEDVVVNLSHLGEQIRDVLENGREFGLRVWYSPEPDPALDTGGGILRALPMLGPDPFWVVNADVCTDYPLAAPSLGDGDDAHLVLVDNPAHNPNGDFCLADGRIVEHGDERLTFAGVGLYRPRLFEGCKRGRFPLVPLLRDAVRAGKVGGEHYRGRWMDVGTVARLDAARAEFGSHKTGQAAG